MIILHITPDMVPGFLAALVALPLILFVVFPWIDQLRGKK